jgi:phosphatidate cytidylyltransferase
MMEVFMIIKLYVFWLMIILIIFSISYYKKSRETLLRVISFFVILNVISLAYILGVYGVIGFATLILLLSIYELSKNYKCKNPLLLTFIILGSYILMLYFNSYLPYVVPFFLIIVTFTFVGKSENMKNNVYLYSFGVLVLATSAASLVSLYKLKPESILLLITLLVINDVTGYFVGRKFGKIRIFKTLSPKKSLEGYIGSMVGIVIGIIVFHSILPVLTGTSLLQNFILLIFFFIFGNAGDLLFSKIKRILEIKDFSSLLPGHGGILDRFDNVLSVSPLFLILLLYYLK